MTTAVAPEKPNRNVNPQTSKTTDPRTTTNPSLALEKLTERFQALKIEDFSSKKKTKKYIETLVVYDDL